MLWTWLIGCGASCPSGWSEAPARVRLIEAKLGHSISGEICFGNVPDLGLQTPERLLLDRAATDELLAARVLHLEHHGPAEQGPGCRQRLLEEEARAWHAELSLRHRLGVAPTGPARHLGPTPDLERVRGWLTTSKDTVPSELRATHEKRCL